MRIRIANFINNLDRIAASKGYYLLAIGLFIFEFIILLNGNWGKDFWEHNAVINELSKHPVDPGNPVLALNVPHAFFSPYTVLLGLIGHLTNLSSFTLLFCAGLINLALLLTAIRYFVFSLFSHNQKKIAFYLLLFELIAWGPAAWRFSSFYHITALNYVLPYPSTFSYVVTLFSISFYVRYHAIVNHFRKAMLLIIIIVLNAVVILIHPTTAIFLYIFMVVYTLTSMIKKFNLKLLIPVILGVAVPLSLVGFWPYYPFWDLILNESQGSQFHLASMTLYAKLFIRLLPVWFILPLLWKRVRENYTDLFVFLFLALLSVYIYGLFSKQYGYGRVIYFMVFTLHIIMAVWFSGLNLKTMKEKLLASGFLFLTLPFLLFHIPLIYKNIVPGMVEKPFLGLKFLSNTVNSNDVILTDKETMLYVPSYGGKVIASLYPAYWIPDNEQRKRDIELYFSNKVSNSERAAILRKHKVQYILLKQDNKVYGGVKSFSYSVSRLVYKNKDYILLRVKNTYNQ
jgi:hypothetical protein